MSKAVMLVRAADLPIDNDVTLVLKLAILPEGALLTITAVIIMLAKLLAVLILGPRAPVGVERLRLFGDIERRGDAGRRAGSRVSRRPRVLAASLKRIALARNKRGDLTTHNIERFHLSVPETKLRRKPVSYTHLTLPTICSV